MKRKDRRIVSLLHHPIGANFITETHIITPTEDTEAIPSQCRRWLILFLSFESSPSVSAQTPSDVAHTPHDTARKDCFSSLLHFSNSATSPPFSPLDKALCVLDHWWTSGGPSRSCMQTHMHSDEEMDCRSRAYYSKLCTVVNGHHSSRNLCL